MILSDVDDRGMVAASYLDLPNDKNNEVVETGRLNSTRMHSLHSICIGLYSLSKATNLQQHGQNFITKTGLSML